MRFVIAFLIGILIANPAFATSEKAPTLDEAMQSRAIMKFILGVDENSPYINSSLLKYTVGEAATETLTNGAYKVYSTSHLTNAMLFKVKIMMDSNAPTNVIVDYIYGTLKEVYGHEKAVTFTQHFIRLSKDYTREKSELMEKNGVLVDVSANAFAIYCVTRAVGAVLFLTPDGSAYSDSSKNWDSYIFHSRESFASFLEADDNEVLDKFQKDPEMRRQFVKYTDAFLEKTFSTETEL